MAAVLYAPHSQSVLARGVARAHPLVYLAECAKTMHWGTSDRAAAEANQRRSSSLLARSQPA